MDTSALVMDEIETGAEFLKGLHAYSPVTAACWLRADENAVRYLYVALDGLTVDNSDIAYREVLRITQGMKDRFIDPFRVKLIRQDHPVAKAVHEIYRRYQGRIPAGFDGRMFPGQAVAEVYIYPQFAGKP